MRERTVYLPESLKPEVGRRPRQRSRSEAEVTGQAIRDPAGRPEPTPGIIPGDDSWVDRLDDYLDGFGES